MFGAQRRATQRANVRKELFKLITAHPNGLTLHTAKGDIARQLAHAVHTAMTASEGEVARQLYELGLSRADEMQMNLLLLEVAEVPQRRRIRVLRQVIRRALNNNELGYIENLVREPGGMPSLSVMTPEQAEALGTSRSYNS